MCDSVTLALGGVSVQKQRQGNKRKSKLGESIQEFRNAGDEVMSEVSLSRFICFYVKKKKKCLLNKQCINN